MTIPELYELFIHNPKVTTDSRNCPRGSIFFALKGDKFDGNQYAEKALASGCVYAVIDNPDYFIGERTILVDNVLTTLQQLAHRHRKVSVSPEQTERQRQRNCWPPSSLPNTTFFTPKAT